MDKAKCPVCEGHMIYNTGHMQKYKMNIPFCEKCGYSNKLDWTPINDKCKGEMINNGAVAE